MSEPQKITREYALANRLVFYPKAPDEAIVIQERILAMGFKWVDDVAVVKRVNECVQKGILLDHGKIYYGPTEDSTNVFCTVLQLDADYLPPAERQMRDMFNALMKRLDDLQEQMNRIEARVSPAKIDKPRSPMTPPKNGGAG